MKKILSLYFLICFVNGFVYGQTQMDFQSSLNDYTTNCSGTYNPPACYFDIWGYKHPVDGREYAIIGVAYGTSFIDITDPFIPVEVEFISGLSSDHRDIKTYQNYAYIATDENGTGLEIVDLSNLPNPVPPPTIWTSPNFTGRAHNVFIDATPPARLFLCGASGVPGEGILMADLTNPANPQEITFYDASVVHDLFVRNDTLFACSPGPVGGPADPKIRIFDVSNNMFDPIVSLPYPQNQYPAEPLINHHPHNVWTTEDGKYMVTADEHDGGAAIFWDIQDVNMITETDPNRFPVKNFPDARMHNVFIKGNFCYIAHQSHGLVVLDIYDINNVIEVATYDTYPPDNTGQSYKGAWGVFPFLPSCNILVSDMKYGLQVLTFPDDEILLNVTIGTGEEIGFVAKNTITATNYTVESGAGSNLVAGVEIVIDGESVIEGEFIARIEDPCAQSTFESQKMAGGTTGNETELSGKTKNNKLSINNQQSSISIHPNPAKEIINIKGNFDVPATFELYDITGRKVLQQPVSSNQ